MGFLLKTLLLSTSDFNRIKYEKNSRRRNKAIGMIVLKLFIFFILSGYAMLTAFGYGMIGMAGLIPIITAAIISMISLFFAFFEVNGYLFAFREYDLIMSLPLTEHQVVSAKFLHMYLRRMPWYMGIALALEIPYIIFATPSLWNIFLWVLGALFLPVIPMLLATVIGATIKGISVGYKHKQAVEILLNLILVGVLFFFMFSMQNVSEDTSWESVLQQARDKVENIAGVIPTIGWFRDMTTKGSVVALLLLAVLSFVLGEAVLLGISIFYKKVNSRLLAGVSLGNYQLGKQKANSLMKALIMKEWRRFRGSSLYLMNCGMGLIITLVLSVASFFMDQEKMMAEIMSQIPEGMNMSDGTLFVVIPVMIGMMISMSDSSCMSPSLEGKNNWILCSLPVTKKQIAQSKIAFNMCLQLPVVFFATVCFSISMKAGLFYMILYLLIGVLFSVLSSSLGLWVGMIFIKLDWENEVEVIKQGAAVAIYMLPTMLVCIGLLIGAVAISGIIGVAGTLFLLLFLLLLFNVLVTVVLEKTVYAS